MKTKKLSAALVSAAMIMLIPCTDKAYAESCKESPAVQTTSSAEAVTELRGEFSGYALYEKYGLLHDVENDCYTYNGSVVRFFNDPVAGASFTNFFTGTVDIEAVYNAENELVGIKECSAEVYEKHTQKFVRFSRS